MAIKGLDSEVTNVKSCNGPLGLLQIRISMIEGRDDIEQLFSEIALQLHGGHR